MVVTGSPDINGQKFEIIDLINQTHKNKFLSGIPLPPIRGSVYGLMNDSAPLICGGNHRKNIFIIGNSIKMSDHILIEKRCDAYGVILNKNTLWVVGGIGYNGNPSLRSEYLTFLCCHYAIFELLI